MKILVGVGLGLLALLWVLGRIKSSESESSTATVATPSASLDKWHFSEGKSPMDDSRTVSLKLKADNTIHGPLGEKTPSLVVRCEQKTTDVYVVTDMASNIEEDSDGGPKAGHTVRIRLDDEQARHETWTESTDQRALFAVGDIYSTRNTVEYPSGPVVPFARALAKAKTLTFQFTPFDGSPQIAKFDLRGVENHIGRVAEACGWPMD